MRTMHNFLLIMILVFCFYYPMGNAVLANNDEIANGLDSLSLQFYNDGWILENGGTDDFICSRDNMSDFQDVFIQTHITTPEDPYGSGNYVPARIMFKWKVNSEKNYDKLIFEIDNVVTKEISGDTGWLEEHFDVRPGAHLLRWTYKKDGTSSHGDDKAYIDYLTITKVPENNLHLGMDFRPGDYNISSSGWVTDGYGEDDFARNTPLRNYGTAFIDIKFMPEWTPTNISFKWHVSSEENYDFLRFKVLNGNQTVISEQISGEVSDWIYKSFSLPDSYLYTIRWEFEKDAYVKRGQDRGFLDKIRIQPEAHVNVTRGLGYGMYPYSNHRWHVVNPKSGSAHVASDDDLKHGQKAIMQLKVPGSNKGQRISFDWKVNSEERYDWLIFRVNSQEKTRISGDIDWETFTFDLPASNPDDLTILEWEYMKDGSVHRGWDQGLLKNLIIQEL